jgi:hypothetical protein
MRNFLLLLMPALLSCDAREGLEGSVSTRSFHQQISYGEACMRFRSKLARLFSGSHLYFTTLMYDWRVRRNTERAYGHESVLSSAMFLLYVIEKEECI